MQMPFWKALNVGWSASECLRVWRAKRWTTEESTHDQGQDKLWTGPKGAVSAKNKWNTHDATLIHRDIILFGNSTTELWWRSKLCAQEQQFAQLSEGSGNVVITRNRRLARIGLILKAVGGCQCCPGCGSCMAWPAYVKKVWTRAVHFWGGQSRKKATERWRRSHFWKGRWTRHEDAGRHFGTQLWVWGEKLLNWLNSVCFPLFFAACVAFPETHRTTDHRFSIQAHPLADGGLARRFRWLNVSHAKVYDLLIPPFEPENYWKHPPKNASALHKKCTPNRVCWGEKWPSIKSHNHFPHQAPRTPRNGWGTCHVQTVSNAYAFCTFSWTLESLSQGSFKSISRWSNLKGTHFFWALNESSIHGRIHKQSWIFQVSKKRQPPPPPPPFFCFFPAVIGTPWCFAA